MEETQAAISVSPLNVHQQVLHSYICRANQVHTENATAVMQAQKRELFTFTSKACLFPPFFCFNCRHQIQVSKKQKKRAESHHKSQWDPVSILD